jgi:signal transduction histidine kinase
LQKPPLTHPLTAKAPPSTLARRLRRTLRWGAGLLLLLAAALAAFGLWRYQEADRAYHDMLERARRGEALINRLADAALAGALHARAYLITGEEQSVTALEAAQADFDSTWERVQQEAAALPQPVRDALDAFQALQARHQQLAAELIGLRRAGRTAEALALFSQDADPLVLELVEGHRAMHEAMQGAVSAASQDFSPRGAALVRLLASGLCVLLAAGCWALLRQLERPLKALDHFETALVETSQAGRASGPPLPPALAPHAGQLYPAYDALAQQRTASETAQLEFMGRVAHDLRAPLAAISGYAALMSQTEALPPGQTPNNYLPIIQRQANRMIRLLDQLVTAARVDAGRLALARMPLRLGPLLQELAAEEAEGERVIEVRDGLGATPVCGDALGLREAFGHLLDNALRYSPAGTPIVVTLELDETPGWALIRIQDQGYGIAPEDQPKLFQRFGRILQPRAAEGAGSGLGLYLVRHILAAHEGSVWLDSRLGEGTTVHMRLPLAPQSPPT